jgi:1-acyl-sn-glycerol-3-phosphate acyltransferase
MIEADASLMLDHHGEALPELTKASSTIRMDRLLKVPQPKWDRAIPGSPMWTRLAFRLLRLVARGQFRSLTSEGLEGLDMERGAMCCAWHVNGLMDPLAIMLTHPSHFVIGGRHDLVTRPILRFWTTRLAVQPVVRKAELLRGGFDEDEAAHLNGRTLLNLSRGISHGHGSALFPEGTAHNEAYLLRLRTGPMRTVLAAAAIAHVETVRSPISFQSASTSAFGTSSEPRRTLSTARHFPLSWTTFQRTCSRP